MIHSIQIVLACCFVGYCVYTDWKERKIFNKITVTGMVVGLLFNTIFNATPSLESGFLFSIQGIALGLILFFIPFTLGGMGAGDLKLLGMIGAFIGWPLVGWTGLYGAICGGLISLYIILVNEKVRNPATIFLSNILLSMVHAMKIDITKLKNSDHRFPYSFAIAIGMVLALVLRS